MMLDPPHTSAPMLMRGDALVLKTPVENAPRTSIEKHLSWSSDIPPAARFPLSPQTNGAVANKAHTHTNTLSTPPPPFPPCPPLPPPPPCLFLLTCHKQLKPREILIFIGTPSGNSVASIPQWIRQGRVMCVMCVFVMEVCNCALKSRGISSPQLFLYTCSSW